jgi:Transposase
LTDYLRGLKNAVVVGFEATGNYHRPLAYFLHRQGFELRLISTLALARTREAMHNSWDKNDPKDAQVILHLLKTGLTQTWHDPMVNGINDVQELSKTHFQVTLARVRIWNTLRNHYFALYFPEIDRFVRSDHSVWMIQLLASFPTPASITALSEEEFQTQAWHLVGRKVNKRALLAEIYAAAKQSIGVPVALDSAASDWPQIGIRSSALSKRYKALCQAVRKRRPNPCIRRARRRTAAPNRSRHKCHRHHSRHRDRRRRHRPN